MLVNEGLSGSETWPVWWRSAWLHHTTAPVSERAPPDDAEPAPVEIPIDGTLDLHTFDPRDLGDLLRDYLDECRRRNILDVRIVHGKGRGVLRASVEAILKRLPEVASCRTAGAGAGEWGATLVRLHPLRG